MSVWFGWGWGLVVLPGLAVLCAVWIRWYRDKKPYPPGSRSARKIGCTCPARENWFGLRAALRGEVRVASDCPVLSHRAERVYGVHLR